MWACQLIFITLAAQRLYRFRSYFNENIKLYNYFRVVIPFLLLTITVRGLGYLALTQLPSCAYCASCRHSGPGSGKKGGRKWYHLWLSEGLRGTNPQVESANLVVFPLPTTICANSTFFWALPTLGTIGPHWHYRMRQWPFFVIRGILRQIWIGGV